MGWKDNLESTFITWSKPSSETEEQRCTNAISMIKSAITAHEKLSQCDISFTLQGSYRNNTNVKLNSDVDICCILKNSIYTQYPPGMKDDDVGLVAGNYPFTDFKKDVENALVAKFGRSGVNRGNKAFDVHSNSYRVDADVVPCFEHRRYHLDKTYILGTQFFTDKGDAVINFPEQHYANGVVKNNETNTYYKKIVRIFKRLRIQMQDDGVSGLDNISSFLIECLIWNVPNSYFTYKTYKEDVESILGYLYHATKDDESCKAWGEVSELLYLFHSGQSYTRKNVNDFILKAYSHVFG